MESWADVFDHVLNQLPKSSAEAVYDCMARMSHLDAFHFSYLTLADKMVENRIASSEAHAVQMLGRCLEAGANKQTDAEVLHGFIRTLWADYWMNDLENRAEDGDARALKKISSMRGVDIYDVAPAVPAAASRVAKTMAQKLLAKNPMTLAQAIVQSATGRPAVTLSNLYLRAMGTEPWNHRKLDTAENFGSSLALEMAGHGVSWEDDHPDAGIKVPYREFYF